MDKLNGFEDLDLRPYKVIYSSKEAACRDIIRVLIKAIWKRIDEVAGLHKMME